MNNTSVTGLRVRIRGQVQGVGFRPCVWQLAQQLALTGFVKNDSEGVLIEVFGQSPERLLRALQENSPALARIDSVETETLVMQQLPGEFLIVESAEQGNETDITPDTATCDACITEVIDPDQRRYDYPFTNCVHCGPRFSILHHTPFDRTATSMVGFTLCASCQAEYDDPKDRRFHAQAIACRQCGPRAWLEVNGEVLTGNPIHLASNKLNEGQIIAVKGIGGFHLMCDALNSTAIETLRQRKRRPHKPLAVMASLNMIHQYASPARAELDLLCDRAAVIVLLDNADSAMPETLAPDLDRLGWMLPYTPLHHLLIARFGGPLVVTSGNSTSEPQVIKNHHATEKLDGIADAILMHDREILVRLDDGVEQVTAPGPMVFRRARGRVPGSLPLPSGFEYAPRVTAYGGQVKSTICHLKGSKLGRGQNPELKGHELKGQAQQKPRIQGQAILSQPLGDLDNAHCWDEFQQTDERYTQLFNHHPTVVACDMHPEYRASVYAATQSADLALIEVQHHHAHLASCLAENLWPIDAGPVAGIILDGLGWGLEGEIWGGEVLVGDYRTFTRAASLLPAPLAGGDAAQREPWRNALVRLDQAGLGHIAEQMFTDQHNPQRLTVLRQAVKIGINSPMSSSAGRLFDAMAACLGFTGCQSYEGQAAMQLEALARRAPFAFNSPYPLTLLNKKIDPTPLFHAWAEDHQQGVQRETIAAKFIAGIARVFANAARAEYECGRAKAVALSGGCFQNATLLELMINELNGIPVLTHTEVPANDGGLAFGQAVVAAALNIHPGHNGEPPSATDTITGYTPMQSPET